MNSHCYAPWKSISVKGSKVGTVCCASSTSFKLESWKNAKDLDYFKVLQRQTLNQAWPSGCETCKKKSERSLPSRKDYFDKNLTPSQKHEIEYLEVNISNHCNYSCVMCGNEFSTQWHALTSLRDRISSAWLDPYKLSHDDIDELIELIQENPIKEIDIQGGEPFILSETEYFLKRLMQINFKGKVLIVTNGSRIQNNILNLISGSLDIHVTVSVDSIDSDLYQIVRSPKISFSQIEKNIDLLTSVSNRIEINSVMMNLNAYLYNKMDEFSFYKVQKPLSVNWISRPHFLRINILNQRQKDLTLKWLDECEHKGAHEPKIKNAILEPTEDQRIETFNQYLSEYCSVKNVSLNHWKLYSI
jgi:wyosine [tRNA(Phe)-imidazoG37] synthetase (radical SAM superfamily)